MQKYCDICKLLDDKICLAHYKNPTTTAEKAVIQAKHKGEWPCSLAPHRNEFINLYRPGMNIRVVK